MPREQKIKWFKPDELEPQQQRKVIIKTDIDAVETLQIGYTIKDSENNIGIDIEMG